MLNTLLTKASPHEKESKNEIIYVIKNIFQHTYINRVNICIKEMINLNMSNNFNNISPEKLNFISDIIKQSENVPQDNMITFFINAAATANAKGINFTDAETELIINSLKANMTKEQINKLETIRNLAKAISSQK